MFIKFENKEDSLEFIDRLPTAVQSTVSTVNHHVIEVSSVSYQYEPTVIDLSVDCSGTIYADRQLSVLKAFVGEDDG